jgi:hypothetical protein
MLSLHKNYSLLNALINARIVSGLYILMTEKTKSILEVLIRMTEKTVYLSNQINIKMKYAEITFAMENTCKN